jgi:TetR/AcrR family transcriptional regulator of autoinduction and epiphytic fitness
MRSEPADTFEARHRIDGRAARSERTRDAVVEAILALIEEGDLRPTGPRIAERAGVSLRSVYQHFADLEALFSRAADLHGERMAQLARPLPLGGPLAERVAAFVAERTRLLEATSPVARAAALEEPFSQEIASRARAAREHARAEVAVLFAPELKRCDPAEREELVAALSAAADWPFWESLRRHQRLSELQAQRVLGRILGALLDTIDLSAGTLSS